jgi:benzoate/toluate 1,2-dioxygenase reductase component
MNDGPSPPVTSARQRPALRACVERIYDHCADTRSLFLRMTAGTLPRFLPGMFISIAIPLALETRIRPYTIASSPDDGQPFEICFNRVPGGPGAAWLFDRVAGDELNFTGPFGAFTLEHAPAAATIMIAEGTAIAPIRPMLRRAIAEASAHPLELLYAADRREHLLYSTEFERLAAAHPQFHFEPIIVGADETAALYARLLDEANRRWVLGDADRGRHFYICGVGKGVLALRDLLRGAGYERRAVHYEQW